MPAPLVAVLCFVLPPVALMVGSGVLLVLAPALVAAWAMLWAVAWFAGLPLGVWLLRAW